VIHAMLNIYAERRPVSISGFDQHWPSACAFARTFERQLYLGQQTVSPTNCIMASKLGDSYAYAWYSTLG
jgi:hypothetical protein